MLLLLACAPGEAPAPEVGESPPVPYIYDEGEDTVVPTLTPEDLEGAIAEAIDVFFTVNAAPIFPAYAAAMSGTDGYCPNYYDYEGSVYWYDQCTADSGTEFSGYGFYQTYDGYDGGDGTLYSGEAFYGVARIEDATGRVFEGGGSAQLLVGTNTNYTSWISTINGAFDWDGPEAEGTWLGSDLSPDLSISALDAPTWDGRYVAIDGGLSGLDGAVGTVVTDSLVLYSASLGSSCEAEPGGVVSVRDAGGDWYDVVFDGPADWNEPSDADLCDGCGEAFFRGEDLGAVCVDFSHLLGWGETPW